MTTLTLPPLAAICDAVGNCGLRVETNQNPLAVQLLVNWNGDGSTYVDEAPYGRALSISRGRSGVNDKPGAGRATVRLRNLEGRFSPENAASPLYHTVVGGRAVAATASYHGVSYPLFVGRISEISQTVGLKGAEVTLTCLDAFEQFRLTEAKADLGAGLVDPTVDAVITAILAAAGWMGPTRLDTGRSLLQYAQPMSNVLQALGHAALQEMGGLLFMGKDGAVVFHNAAHRQHTGVSAVLFAVESMQLATRSTDIVQNVRVGYNTYTWPQSGATPSSVYSGQAGRQLPPQASTTFTDFLSSAAAIDVIAPQQTTDYTANSAADGSGLDVTDMVWLESFTASGVDFTATLYNALPYPVYLARFSIRGTALQRLSTPPFVLIATTGALVPSQRLDATFDFITDAGDVLAWAQQRLAAMSRQRPRPSIQLAAKTPDLTHLLLSLDIGSRLVIRDDGAPYLSGLNGQFFVENIQLDLSFNPPAIARATLQLFDSAQGAL
jgi:hypothetical protein